MDRFKKRLLVIVILVLIGLWFGYNIGKGRTFYANPFQSSEQAQFKDKAKDVLQDTKKVIRDSLDDNK